MATARKSKGRQRVEMAKMEKESNLQVTFSKRRYGLFKKASELSTLCGAETAIIVFSPGNKAYSFGHPSVESIVDRFLTRNPLQDSGAMQLFKAHQSANICELNMHLTRIVNKLEAEKNRSELLENIRKASQTQCWWAGAVEELSLEQLELLKMSLEVLKAKVIEQADNLMLQGPNPPDFFSPSSIGVTIPHDGEVTGFDPLNYGGVSYIE